MKPFALAGLLRGQTTFCALLFLTVAGVTGRGQSAATWNAADVGPVGAAGSASEANGTLTLKGSGADIAGTADEFFYRYTAWSGSGMFVARVTSFESVDNWAKVGIMVRADTTPGAAHVFACVNPARDAAELLRGTSGGTTTFMPPNSELRAMPMWLKLIRDGDDFMMYWSSDGALWRPFSAKTTVAMAPDVLVGLAITSKADGRLATATVDQVQFGPIKPTDLFTVTRSATRVELRWFDHALRETGFEIERSTDNVTFTRIAVAPAHTGTNEPIARFFDETASPSTSYWYRVRAIWAGGTSAYTNTVNVTTAPTPPGGWTTHEIGDTSLGGSMIASGGALEVSGSGSGVGSITTRGSYMGNRGVVEFSMIGGADEFFYAARQQSAEGEIVARVTNVSGPTTAQAGILVRGGTDPSAASVFLFVRPDRTGGVLTRLAYRSMGSTENSSWLRTPLPSAAIPLWFKLVHTSGGIMSYVSADGAAWTELEWSKPVFPAEVSFGLGVSSGADGTLATGVFDNVVVGPVATPLAPPAPQDLRVTQVSFGTATLQWTDATTKADPPEIERSLDGVTFTKIAASWSPFVDREMKAATTYHYRVRAVRGTHYSNYSNTVTVTTPAVPPPPQDLTATPLSPTSVDLTWRPVAGAQYYSVERSTDGVNFTYLQGTSAASHYDFTAKAATRYYYRVLTSTDGGSSAPSSTVSVTTPEVTPTGSVAGLLPMSRSAPMGSSVILLAPDSTSSTSYRWYRNGVLEPYQTYREFQAAATARGVGLYSVDVTNAGGSFSSWPAALGILMNGKTNTEGAEVGTDIRHPNGNIYDQVLATNVAPAVTADPGQVLRISFVDLSNDIVQLEFSGAGTLAFTLAASSPPAPPAHYDQPGINYMKGHAGIVIAGADETTNVTIFSVGRKTALNQTLFRSDVNYDGFADIAFIAILSTNGRFGGLRAGNASFWADQGFTGVFAPGVTFVGPVYVGDISAQGTARPLFAIGGTTDARVTGGDLAQGNGRPVEVTGPFQLHFTGGEDSHARVLPAKQNQARFEREGQDVTNEVVARP